MNNDEVVAAFAEFLQADSRCGILMAISKPVTALAILSEFGNAIEPVPLAEVTDREIRVFLRDHKVPAVSVRPLPLSEAHAKTRLEKAKAELLYTEYQAAMECFRLFRRSAMKSRRVQS